MDEPEIVVDVARGDATLSREIVTSLRSIADATGDPAFAKLVEQVTPGELGVRELAGTEVFSSMLDRLVAPVLESLKETTFEDLVEERPDPHM